MDVRTVAVIGAGVSGVSSAIHLRNAGLDVTVFERGDVAGGVWVYDPRIALEPSYPATLPSVGDSPAFDSLLKSSDRKVRRDSPVDQDSLATKRLSHSKDLEILHAPPGPCYQGLHNNVSTPEMKLRTHDWNPNTPDFVPHEVLATYIQDTAAANKILSAISFRTRVIKVEKEENKWEVSTARLIDQDGEKEVQNAVQGFDAVIVASGHYHAPNIPDYINLKAWKTAFPTRIWHSKSYRSPAPFAGKNVLVIGAGVSSTDICRELGGVANKVWQSSRGGEYDLLPSMLPDNCTRIGAIANFSPLTSTNELGNGDALPGNVVLTSNDTITDIHHIILATGYHMSYPFLSHLHADNLLPSQASNTVLVTTGQVTHNLHKDIFYIPDPTLAFIGVPYHVATFSLFEFQALAVAEVFAGSANLPWENEMRKEYEARVARKGVGVLHLRIEALYTSRQPATPAIDPRSCSHDYENMANGSILTYLPAGWTEERYKNATDDDWETLTEEEAELLFKREIAEKESASKMVRQAFQSTMMAKAQAAGAPPSDSPSRDEGLEPHHLVKLIEDI
ncbi:FAD/NAD(P)-binding domain-containing protein, partial [Aureobasidium melanogenum]